MSCVACQKVFNVKTVRITCGKCSGSYHKSCSKIKDDQWNCFVDGSVLFNCSKCRASRRSSVIGVPAETQPTSQPQLTELSTIRADISSFKATIESVITNNKDIEASLTNLHETMTTIEDRLQTIEIKLKAVDEVVAENTRLRNQMTLVEKRIEALENGQKLPRKQPSGTYHVYKASITGTSLKATENVTEVVDKIVSHLGLVTSETIVKSELIKPKDKQISIIMVTLPSADAMKSLITAAKKDKPTDVVLGGDGSSKIFINECPPTQCYELLKEARKLTKFGYKFVWAHQVKVFAREAEGQKVSLISSKGDIDALRQVNIGADQ